MTTSDPHNHCLTCFKAFCSYDSCKLISCGFCPAVFHSCKRDDHLEVCPNVIGPCVNSIYGCQRKFKRAFLKSHLAQCPAMVVVCHMHWNRSALSESAKKQIKRAAKGLETDVELKVKPEELGEKELDVVEAVLDQKAVLNFFKLRRDYRITFRDYFTPQFPILPVLAHKTPLSDDVNGEFHDSSDDEKKAEAKKIRKKRLPWANCYICKTDPASQHLHVLGNLSNEKNGKDKAENGNSVKDALFVPEFYRKRGVMLSRTINRVPGSVKKGATIFDIAKGRPFFTFQCEDIIHRSELEDHTRFHGFEDDDWYVHRCPFSSEGCDFVTSGLDPSLGRFRCSKYLHKIVHEPKPSVNAPLETLDEGLFYEVLPLVLDHLDSADLCCLSAVSLKTKGILGSRRQIVTFGWTRTEDFYGNVFWEENEPRTSFSRCQRCPTVLPTVAPEYWQHLKTCEFRKMAEPEVVKKQKTFLLMIQEKTL
ncbi:hypothetical protein L596_020423 [Steinernema carpocapsae]|uniref:TRAF-type domain-containing protein n=1 Tax=Steinernema carpocapsae TaxID=34508 RepID=A0A4U5MTG9_STECR|nr:hypothetical protein L596_020423 [Steinernema carpocapsae]